MMDFPKHVDLRGESFDGLYRPPGATPTEHELLRKLAGQEPLKSREVAPKPRSLVGRPAPPQGRVEPCEVCWPTVL